MKRRSALARIWVFATIAALAFSQVALAAFACPSSVPMNMEAMASADAPCADSDMASRHLCAKTCQDEPQKSEVASLAALPPRLDTGLRVEMAAEALNPVSLIRDPALVRATSPPPDILFARLRE